MVKPEWGMKLTCQHCGAVFYDMRKSPPSCPKCGAEQEQEKPRARRGAAAAAAAAAPKPAETADEPEMETDDEVLVEGEEDEDEDEFLEDTSDMGDDEDDMAGMIDGIEESGEKE